MPPKHEDHQYDEITDDIHEQQPYYVEDYTPVFDRDSRARRVLAHITDEEDAAAGGVPRNTAETLTRVLAADDKSPDFDLDPEQSLPTVEAQLDRLVEAGLVSQRKDGSYKLTEDGYREVYN
jgi:hypothetical protein